MNEKAEVEPKTALAKYYGLHKTHLKIHTCSSTVGADVTVDAAFALVDDVMVTSVVLGCDMMVAGGLISKV